MGALVRTVAPSLRLVGWPAPTGELLSPGESRTASRFRPSRTDTRKRADARWLSHANRAGMYRCCCCCGGASASAFSPRTAWTNRSAPSAPLLEEREEASGAREELVLRRRRVEEEEEGEAGRVLTRPRPLPGCCPPHSVIQQLGHAESRPWGPEVRRSETGKHVGG